MTFKKVLTTAMALTVLAGAMTTPAGARSAAGFPTPVTFKVDVQMPGMILPAGNYIFERVNPETSLGVVLVRSQRGKAQWLGHTNIIERRKAGDSLVQMSEAPRGEAPRVLTWFPTGSTTGAAFIY